MNISYLVYNIVHMLGLWSKHEIMFLLFDAPTLSICFSFLEYLLYYPHNLSSKITEDFSCYQLLDEEVYHFHTKLMMKEARFGGKHLWHQDYG